MPVSFDSPESSGRVVFDSPSPGGVVFDAPTKTNEQVLAEIGKAAVAERSRLIPDPFAYHPSPLATTALRVGVPLTVGMATGGLGLLPAMGLTGLSAAAGEAGAETMEMAGGQRDSLSPSQIAASGAINSYPGATLDRIASPLIRSALRIAEGAGIGASYPLLESGLRGELPQISDVKQGALYGGVMGLPFGAIEGLGARAQNISADAAAAQQQLAAAREKYLTSGIGEYVAPGGVTPIDAALARPRLEAQFNRAKLEEQLSGIPGNQLSGPEEVVFSTTPEQIQLSRLDGKFGIGQGAAKERARLQAVIDAKQGTPPVEDQIPAMSGQAQSQFEQAEGQLPDDSAAKLMGLSRRLQGKTPEQQLAVVNQEMRLQKGILTPNQQRAALDVKQGLENQVDTQKAVDDAAKAQQDAADASQTAHDAQIQAAQDIQKAQAQDAANAQKAAAAANKPPEIPKSAQILAEPNKPAPIANVATEIGTQTSPFQVQKEINEKLTGQPPTQQIGAPTPAAQQIAPAPAPASGAAPEAPVQIQAAEPAMGVRIPSPAQAKLAQTKLAAKSASDFQYTVFRPGQGIPDAIQVDAIGPKGEALGSSNVADLNKAGANLPKVPDWVPQGTYTLEQMKDLIKQGEPTNAIPKQITGEVGVRNEAALRQKVGGNDRPEITAQEGVTAGNQVREGPVREALRGAPKRVRIAGSEYDVVKANPDGTLTLKSDGGEFDTNPGEQWQELADIAPTEKRDIDFSRVSREQFAKQEVDAKVARRKIALLEAENDIRRKWKPSKQLPIGASKVQALLSKERLNPDEKKLRAAYSTALSAVSADLRTDFETAGKVYDRLKAPQEPAPLPAEQRVPPEVFAEVPAKNGLGHTVGGDAARIVWREPNGKYRVSLTTADAIARNEAPRGHEDFNTIEEARKFAAADGRFVAQEASSPIREQRLNDAGQDLKPPAQMSRQEKYAELKQAGVTTYNGKPIADINPAELTNALGKLRQGKLIDPAPDIIDRLQSMKRLPKRPRGEVASAGPDLLYDTAHDAALDVAGRRSQSGHISPSILTPIVGASAGATYGASKGDTPEERAVNAGKYGLLGLGLGTIAGAGLTKLMAKPIRDYQSPELKAVAKMLTPQENKEPFMSLVHDAYNNLRYRFNTPFAPIGAAQRVLFKRAGMKFTPGAYYDLERGFERLAGAPAQAEGEVELLQNIVNKLGASEVQHFDTYLVLSRIKDRLTKTAEENARLQDAVGMAQAEYESAQAANKTAPGVRNSGRVVSAREALNSANRNLTENFDRKRVADWTIDKAQKGLTDLQAEVGPDTFAKLQAAGVDFQNVMQRTLQIQVDAGRMTPELKDLITQSNDFYAPFKVLKYFDDNEGFMHGAGTNRIPSAEQLAKKITGIDDADVRLGSPLAVAAEQVYKGYILAQKNIKMNEFAGLAGLDGTGTYIKPLAPGMNPDKGFDRISYLDGGQTKTIQVARSIADSLNGAGRNETDLILRSLGSFAKVFKAGATMLSIPFNIVNSGVSDPIRLATISRYGFRGPQDFLYTLYEWPKALVSSVRGNLGQYLGMTPDALYETWIKSGAAGSTLARVMTPEAFGSKLPREMNARDLLAQNNYGAGVPLKIASLISNSLEETTKIWGLQRAMRIERLDKLSPAARAQKWDEIVTEIRNYAGSPDFARMGVSMKALNILMPFTNARWQGFIGDFSRLNPFRQGNAKDAALAWTRLTGLVGLPSAALMVYNLSTPENEHDYNQIPDQEKQRYFHIPRYLAPDGKSSLIDYGKGGYYFKNKDGELIRGYTRIPKREFPGLIANTTEDFISYLKKNSAETFSNVAANFADNAFNVASPLNFQGNTAEERMLSAASGLNPAIRAPLEVGTNKDFFTGRDIVPERLQKVSPENQYTDSTPESYKQAARSVPNILPDTFRSPLKLQHITEAFTGGFARQFAQPRLSPGNPALETSPLLGRFYRSERVDNTALDQQASDAEQGRADQHVNEQRVAQKLAQIIESKPTPEEKQKVLEDANKVGLMNQETQQYLKDELTDVSRGLNYDDRTVKRSFSVAGGFRAAYYIKKLQSVPPAQRSAYIQEQQQKGLLTQAVGQQMQALVGAK